MLKIRIWDCEAMHKSDYDYDGPVEYLAKQCFIDHNGFFRFQELNGNTRSYNPDEYMIDIFGEC